LHWNEYKKTFELCWMFLCSRIQKSINDEYFSRCSRLDDLQLFKRYFAVVCQIQTLSFNWQCFEISKDNHFLYFIIVQLIYKVKAQLFTNKLSIFDYFLRKLQPSSVNWALTCQKVFHVSRAKFFTWFISWDKTFSLSKTL